MRLSAPLGVWVVLTLLVGCAGDPGPLPPSPGPGLPDLPSHLVSGLFDWPERDFSPDNRAPLALALGRGDRAVDFTLRTLEGKRVRLAELLATRPVLLLLGSYSCPAYHDAVADFASLLDDPQMEGLHVVHVYVVEAHPLAPDVSPHYGAVLESATSVDRNARTYAERQRAADRMAWHLPDSHLLLVDDLRPEGPDNPVWCTYGTAASSAFLIRPDGQIVAAQLWADATTMETAIRRVLAVGEG